MRLPLDLSAEVRAARARQTPQLAFTETDLPDLLERTRRELLPALRHTLEVWFVESGRLACVYHSADRAVVFVHAVLNHHKTPAKVFRLVAAHELLHLVVEPREVDGVLKQHPPEFFEREKSLVLDREEAWAWIYNYFYETLRFDKEREGIWVKGNWRSVWRRLNRPGLPEMPERFRRPTVEFM
jgi:hypothetical protein